MSIPRIVHHVWPGDDPMPEEFRDYVESWRRYHPRWEHRLWTPDELFELPMRQRAIYEDAEQHAPRDAIRFRADVARLEILLEFGGLYVDTDVECLRPVDELLEGAGAVVGISPNAPRGRFLLTQAVMGTEPGHPWVRECVDSLPDAVRKHAGEHIARMVGPWHVTRCYERLDAPDRETVKILSSRLFFPQTIRDRDLGRPVDLEGAYGWHKWSHSRDRKRGLKPGRRTG